MSPNKSLIAALVLCVAALPLLGQESGQTPPAKKGGCPLMAESGQKECPVMGGMHKEGQERGHIWKELNLTDEQKAKLKELRSGQAPAHKKEGETMRDVRQKIKAELLKEKPDRVALNKLTDEIANSHRQMARDRTEHLLKVKQILTKEQFEKMLSAEDGPKCGMSGPCCPHKKSGAGRPHNQDSMPPPPDGPEGEHSEDIE
jgi:Spy/CpxP family protein refolding chaperone